MISLSQNERVKRHLETFGKITSIEAFREYGITRLSARIWDLRHKYGLVIESVTKCAKNRFGEPTHYDEYTLRREKNDV